jgi:hypothetical protein
MSGVRHKPKKVGRPQKLSEHDVRDIAKRYGKGEMLTSLAREYEVRPETLSRRLSGKIQPKIAKSNFSDWEFGELRDAREFLKTAVDAMASTSSPSKEQACWKLIDLLKEELLRRDPDFQTWY